MLCCVFFLLLLLIVMNFLFVWCGLWVGGLSSLMCWLVVILVLVVVGLV